nr:retrovirus-related Pol polyprotein from transposon TNT 1-94 [Tanacetum cinerariifolium]
MLLAMKVKARSNLNNEENDFMLDTSYGEKTMEELTAAVMFMARIQLVDGNAKTVPSNDVKAVSKNQDLLITISEIKNKLKTVDKGKNVNTKFDKSEASGTLLYVTPLPKNIETKAKKVSNSKVNADRSLCYQTNNRNDLGKMKPKDDIGIFIGYSELSRGFRIYNRQTKKIMESIYIKFDELTYMASKCNNLEPEMNCMNFQDSSEDSQSIPSKSDLDNSFGPLYEEYYTTSSQEVSDNSAVNTLDNEHTSSSSSIVVEEDEAPQIVSSLAKQVATEPSSPVLNENSDEFVQEDVVDFDGNMFYN